MVKNSKAEPAIQKPLFWEPSCKKDLLNVPDSVQDKIGYALYLAQCRLKHADAKPLKGFKGAGVLEVVENDDGNTYRAVYTVKFPGAVFVLHVFQKKSKSGISTPTVDIEKIQTRIKAAEKRYGEWIAQQERSQED